jgi:hypothetical protein
MFLEGALGATLAIPLLESLLPRAARGAAAAPIKRFIVMKTYSTQVIFDWYPTMKGNGYILKDDKYTGNKADQTTLLTKPVEAGSKYMYAPLADFATAGISQILGTGLNPFLPKLTLLRGLDFLPATNHNYAALLGNYSSCDEATPAEANMLPKIPTIDQVLAYSKKFYPTTPAARSLHMSQGIVDTMAYSDLGIAGGEVKHLQARTNPLDAFKDVFGMGGAMMDDAAAKRRRDQDALLLDQVHADYLKLKSNPRLSAADKQQLDQYASLITELQQKLQVMSAVGCMQPAAPPSLANNQTLDTADITQKYSLMIDIMAAAIMCDRTRIVTLDVHKALGPGPDPNNTALVGHFHNPDSNGGSWHGLAHDWANANSRRMLAGINTWVANNVFLKILQKLDVPEAGGQTYLDNSLVYWGNELGFNHINYSVPCILAGSAGGYIKPGRYIDYIDWDLQSYFAQEDGNVIRGLPHNRFLVTVLQAMGLSPADYEKGGKPGYGATDTLGKPADKWPVDYDFTKIGEVLPGIQG